MIIKILYKDLRKFYSKYIFPNSTQQDLIIEILIENYIEKIARKSFYMDENNKKRAFYELLNSDEKFYIHPNSFLFASLPDFLIYNEVFFAKK